MQAPHPFREERPWGEELWISKTAPSMVKIITVKPGQALSLQYHRNKDEFWHILSGNGTATLGTSKDSLTEQPLKAGDDCFIPREMIHRFEGGTEDLVALELAFGDFDESDIVRLEDRYGRTDSLPKSV